MFEFDYYQLSFSVVLLILTFFLVLIIGLKNKKDIFILSMMFFWHTFFCIAYYVFSFYNAADATIYYQKALLGDYEFYPGSRFVILITSAIYNLFDFNYFNCFLFFNIFGVIGLVLFFKTLKPYIDTLGLKWYLLLFIPSMSFWSSALGKDAIVFFAVCLFLYSIVRSEKIILFVPISFFFMFMIRPHVAAVMVLSYFIYLLLISKIHIFLKSIFLAIIFLTMYLSLGFIKSYVGLDEVSLTGVGDYVDYRQSVNQSGGSSFDLSSMSYPMQMFTYIFRPLPFDAHNSLALFTSFENIIILFLFIYIIFKIKFNFKYFFDNKNFWLLVYFILSWSILAVTTANLGIATRQKWMFMPVFIYLIVYSFYKFKYQKNTSYKV